jgi:hypothetical protein
MKRLRTGIPWGYVALAGLGLISTQSTGQTNEADRQQAAVIATTELPDSPGAVLAASASAADPATPDTTVIPTRNVQESSVLVPARKYHRVVRPYEQASPLTGFDKIKLSIISRATWGELAGTTWSAAWSGWRNSRPHYGTNAEAFEKRLGALAIKQTSQSFFTYGVYAAAFHDDPRYYIMGPTEKPMKRAIWSAERTIFTQKDDGSPAINWPKLAGIATSTALTTAYYPTVDHGFGNESKAFAMSLATSVLNDELHEFSGDVIRLIRHKKD